MSWFRRTQTPPSSPTSVEKPLVSSINATKSSDMQPKRFRRGGNNPTGLNRFLNVVKPLKSAEKKKYRLLKGAEIGDLAMVKEALNDGADVNTRNDSGRTALIISSIKGHVDIVRELLSGEGHPGALIDATIKDDSYSSINDVNYKLPNGITALYVASVNGYLEVVRELLSGEGHQGAAVDAANSQGITPLYAASAKGHVDVVRELLSGEGHQGAAVDAAANSGFTPLHVASAKGHAEVVRELLLRGAVVDAESNLSKTPLYIASERGHLEVVRELLSGEGHPGALIDAALKHSSREPVYSEKDAKGATPLYVASLEGHLEIVRELLSGEGHQGAAVDAAAQGGITPLIIASWAGHFEVVKELLARGAAVDAAMYDGTTPLIIASYVGHLEVVKELLFGEGHQGAAVDAAKNDGATPLKLAATPEIKALLKQAMAASATGGRRRRTRRTRHTKRKASTRRKV